MGDINKLMMEKIQIIIFRIEIRMRVIIRIMVILMVIITIKTLKKFHHV
jgi:hypothetical protein